MRLVILILALIGFGCAHQRTIHEVCSDPTVVVHFKDYDQCYAEGVRVREERSRQVQTPLFNFPKSTNCTTTGTSSYGNYYGTTECN